MLFVIYRQSTWFQCINNECGSFADGNRCVGYSNETRGENLRCVYSSWLVDTFLVMIQVLLSQFTEALKKLILWFTLWPYNPFFGAIVVFDPVVFSLFLQSTLWS